ncbi:hypothetical protein U728_813 [Clostridium botulinum 202F]|nr:hypothetical protein U728_813 [Clostridium botulinum 202F]KAI3344273.1 DUF2634 domain-containing protein [Clostridium botulinum]MBY6987618.1 DUF2634 domain-containing protein [Clostridium botulinum]NFH01784.1 DUF2634 domain-containing protein [Clostridium botulinum]NFP39508.1 DUF2634 domain-containing protein [Clostridium botulinum]
MPNLFPTANEETINLEEDTQQKFKGSYAINFETGEFIKNSDGTIKILDEFEAYVQWCEKAMLTARYKYGAYSDRYGKDIIGSDITDKKFVELELKRITQEALMVHPLTKSVDSFSFEWKGSDVYYSFEVTTTKNRNKVLKSNKKV